MSRSTYDAIFPDTEETQPSTSATAFNQRTASYDAMSQDSSASHHKIVFEMFGLKLRLAQLKYMTFLVTGVALLWPWNCYLSASEYFSERLVAGSKLSNSYSSTMMTISTVASLIYNFILSQKQANVDYATRLKLGQMLTVLVFLVIGLSCVVKTDINPTIYFVFIMCTVLCSALSTCISQNGTMALVTVLGPIYANGVIVGQSIAGVLPSITLIVSVLTSKLASKELETVNTDKNYGVMLYFFMSCLVNILSVACYKAVEYFEERSESYAEVAQQPISMTDNSNKNPDENDLAVEDDVNLEDQLIPNKHVSFGYLWSKLKLIVITIFITFSVTLVFPVFASSVESTNFNQHPDSKFLNKNVFVPFIFLVWNVGDFVGRLSCAWSFFKISDPRKLIIYAVARLLMVPFFFLCNIKNNGAFIDSDIFYIGLQFLFGFSNGQLCSSSFMDVGHFVDGEHEQKAAGGFTTVFLSFGLAFGSIASYLLVWLISAH